MRTGKEECDAFFSIHPPDNQYLTGFTGSTSGVLVTQAEALFLCDFRYTEQAGEQVQGYAIEEIHGPFPASIAEKLNAFNVQQVAFNPAGISVQRYQEIDAAFSGQFKPLPSLLSDLRTIKSPEEIALIRAASELAESVLPTIKAMLHEPGITEREVAARMEYEFKRRGASGPSFDPIVLFGARSSLPHGEPTETVLQSGDIVLLDFGCRMNGYCSDLTRTYVFGDNFAPWLRDYYGVVLAAQQRALEAVRPGISCRELDAQPVTSSRMRVMATCSDTDWATESA